MTDEEWLNLHSRMNYELSIKWFYTHAYNTDTEDKISREILMYNYFSYKNKYEYLLIKCLH